MTTYPLAIGEKEYSRDELLEVGKNKFRANIYEAITGVSFILIAILNAVFVIFFDQVVDTIHQFTYVLDVFLFIYYLLRWLTIFWIANGIFSLGFLIFGIVMFVRSFKKKKDKTYVQAGINYLYKQQRKMKKA